VILGLALALRSVASAGIAWLKDADPIRGPAAYAGVVIFVSWRLARGTIDALLDAAPLGVRAGIIHAVTSVEGVVEVDRVVSQGRRPLLCRPICSSPARRHLPAF